MLKENPSEPAWLERKTATKMASLMAALSVRKWERSPASASWLDSPKARQKGPTSGAAHCHSRKSTLFHLKLDNTVQKIPRLRMPDGPHLANESQKHKLGKK